MSNLSFFSSRRNRKLSLDLKSFYNLSADFDGSKIVWHLFNMRQIEFYSTGSNFTIVFKNGEKASLMGSLLKIF